jgi:septal ring factor EnvC (AmiA/AmiB activator)
MNRLCVLVTGMMFFALQPGVRGEDSDEVKQLKERIQQLEAKLKAAEKENDTLRKEIEKPRGKPEEVRGKLRRAFYRSGDAEQQRNAVIDQILRTQVALADLDGRLEKQRASALSEALDADEEVRDLRSRIRQARDTLAEYRTRGNLDLPTPAAARRTVEELQPALAQRVKKIEEDLRARAESPEPLRRVRSHLSDELAELRDLLDGLNADAEKGKARNTTDAPEPGREAPRAVPNK